MTMAVTIVPIEHQYLEQLQAASYGSSRERENRVNGAHRTACVQEGPADDIGLLAEPVVCKKPLKRLPQPTRRGLLPCHAEPGAELFNLKPNDRLFAHLGNNEHGHTVEETLPRAVHAAVCHKRLGTLKHHELWHLSPHDEVLPHDA